MPGAVRVTNQGRRNIYTDRNYTTSRPASTWIIVPFGSHTFETLDRRNCIDNRNTARVTAANPRVEIGLNPVNPPEC
jgi:hypothetical protein